MIYVTEQQIVFTAGTVVIVGLVALLLGRWWGVGQGREQGYEEREREEREEAKAHRTHPVYRRPPEIAHEPWFDRDETARALADWETVLMPTAVLHPAAITTGEIQAITDEMDAWLAKHVYSRPADYGQWIERQAP